MALISKLRVRPGKTVYDDKGVILGHGGQMLELDAPIRESDKSKVTLAQVDTSRPTDDDEPMDDDFDTADPELDD